MPAAAVIRKVLALSGFIGFKGSVGGSVSVQLNVGAHHRPAARTAGLECVEGWRNSWCSGEMLRYHEELRLRRQLAVSLLTLKLESAGIEQD